MGKEFDDPKSVIPSVGGDKWAAKWRRQIRDCVDSYNRLIERAGVFGEEFQDWDDPQHEGGCGCLI